MRKIITFLLLMISINAFAQNHVNTDAVLHNAKQLLNDGRSPVYNNTGTVTIIQFFDYQCIYCMHINPVVREIMKEGNIKYIFKELPKLGYHIPISINTSLISLNIWDNYGINKYLAFHNAIYATGKAEGELTIEDIERIIKSLHINLSNENTEDIAEIKLNFKLAKSLGIETIPTFIILPSKNPTAEKITILSGSSNIIDFKKAILKASQGS